MISILNRTEKYYHLDDGAKRLSGIKPDSARGKTAPDIRREEASMHDMALKSRRSHWRETPDN